MYKKLIYFLSKVINVCNRVRHPFDWGEDANNGGGVSQAKKPHHDSHPARTNLHTLLVPGALSHGQPPHCLSGPEDSPEAVSKTFAHAHGLEPSFSDP